MTCGGLQSNHARATALVCASLGLACVLLLRVPDPSRTPLPRDGNVLLDRLAGAEIRLVSHDEYARRGAVMESVAVELRDRGKRPYVVPEGGSNGLGALGYVECMRETAAQMGHGLAGGKAPFDVVVHACGSGGTAAGVALGASQLRSRPRAFAPWPSATTPPTSRRPSSASCTKRDRGTRRSASLRRSSSTIARRAPRTRVSSLEQRETIVRVSRASGLVLDPVYCGKAMHGLQAAVERGDIARGARVLFLHTGGLPGLLAQGDTFGAELA